MDLVEYLIKLSKNPEAITRMIVIVVGGFFVLIWMGYAIWVLLT